ncbi:MAG: hypothetical protein P8Z30_20720, partial [Acidobacteriota bacterium]
SIEGIPERQPARENAGPRLHITTNSSTFHIGEVIPLELSFTSATPNRYLINMARYDRSGRMNYEHFVVSPRDGTRDPLRLYFNSIWGYLGGGLTGYKDLSLTPTLIHLNLNEWVSFDKPGKYELQVISRRVSDVEAGSNSYIRPLELKSNVIELQISLPDAAWQKKQLAEIIESLDRAGQPGDQSSHDPYWAALTALRFLGTKGAARELARVLRGENVNVDWQCMFGLIGSPNRAAGLEEMNKLLEDPAFPVGEMFLNTMSILPLDPDAPPGMLRKEHAENLTALRQRLASAVASKQGRALAISLNTVMRGQKLSPELRNQLVPQLIRVFSQLSLEKQLEWLRYRWNQIKAPGWIPTLRAIALRYQDFPLLTESHAYQSLQVSGEALVRWYGLDPKGARSAVIAEITRPKPRYNARILGILPDKTLPVAEHQIAAHFLDGNNFQVEGNLASLLFRYADAAVLPEVLGKVEERVGKWSCEPQDSALAYVLKVNPSAAGPLIERAIQARGPGYNACRHMLLTDIGRLKSSPVLEKLAVKSLDDPDPQVAMERTVGGTSIRSREEEPRSLAGESGTRPGARAGNGPGMACRRTHVATNPGDGCWAKHPAGNGAGARSLEPKAARGPLHFFGAAAIFGGPIQPPLAEGARNETGAIPAGDGILFAPSRAECAAGRTNGHPTGPLVCHSKRVGRNTHATALKACSAPMYRDGTRPEGKGRRGRGMALEYNTVNAHHQKNRGPQPRTTALPC